MFDEFRPVGRDYGDPREVAVYDETHATFRDVVAECGEVLDKLALPRGAMIADIGAGTGVFAVEAARRGLRVRAVDVSAAMLERARQRAEEAGVDGVTSHRAGFLTCAFDDESLDAVTTTYALHHLPDFWKGVALKRLSRMLKPGGQFWLRDVVLAEEGALDNIAALVAQQAETGGDFMREDAEGHFREEFSTYDWVMAGLLERAGFEIREREMKHGVLAGYLAVRRAS